MKNKKQSSVELLYDELIAFIIPAHTKIVEDLKIKQQFKEIHKEEILQTFEKGYVCGYRDNGDEGIDYYNETFGGDDDK